MRDQQIDTLSITSADNELEGVITVKDLATANMDVFDTAVLAKSRTSYKNILETLNGTMVVGNATTRSAPPATSRSAPPPPRCWKAAWKRGISSF